MTPSNIYPVLILIAFTCTGSSVQYDYGMVIDAGSTHSQLFVYQFEDRVSSTSTAPKSTPIQIAASDSTGPVSGIQTQQECNQLISSLLNFAKTELKKDQNRWNESPVYLKATAGMRILANNQREQILSFITNSFLNTAINPFLFDPTQAIIASGEEEATFDWLGVNIIFNTLINNNLDQNTLGSLDLGGESTEIAFAASPSGNILADFTAVRLWQTTHRLYTHSFLQYGTVAIEQRVAQSVFDSNNNDITYNPCLNNGTNITYIIQFKNGSTGANIQFGSSSGNPYKCREILQKFLYNNTKCLTNSCSINGVYQPVLPNNMTFIAFSAFAYATGNLNLPDVIDLYEFYYDITVSVCNMTYDELKKMYPYLYDQYLIATCRLNTYIFTLLYEGYGFTLHNTNIVWTNKYNNSVITWTEGSILRDSNWLPYNLSINTTISAETECQWQSSDGKHVLNISSIKGKSFSITDGDNMKLVYVYSPCANTMLCDSDDSIDDIYAMLYLMDVESFECYTYFAIYENGKIEPHYNEELKMWQFVYTNGKLCGGFECIFIVNWICDQASEIPQIVKINQDEQCVYVMDINSTFACA
eukprot:131997_1